VKTFLLYAERKEMEKTKGKSVESLRQKHKNKERKDKRGNTETAKKQNGRKQ
jgi:hypothetical protein